MWNCPSPDFAEALQNVIIQINAMEKAKVNAMARSDEAADLNQFWMADQLKVTRRSEVYVI